MEVIFHWCILGKFHRKAAWAMVAICLSLMGTLAWSQEPARPTIDLAEFVQRLLPLESDASDQTDLYESLLLLYTNPLDLNQATREELAATYVLSEAQLNALMAYRQAVGPFLSVYELQAIDGFDLPSIFDLLPFVTVQPPRMGLRTGWVQPTQHFLMVRSGKLLEQQKGFSAIDTNARSNTRYLGPAWNGYIRYRKSRTGLYSLGFTIEKDAGERPWNWSPKRQIFGPDFTSFHAQVLNRGRVKNLLLGDYQLQVGQGLVFAAGFSLGMGSEVIRSTYRSTLGLRPYTSALEANYMRGLAATIRVGPRLDVTLLGSSTRRDGSLDQAVADPNEAVISSLVGSGYHRTAAERDKHGNISEQNIGFHSLYRLKSQQGQLGLTSLYTHYGIKIQRKAQPYNYYEFSGADHWVLGLHGDYHWQNFHFFGEGARSQSGGIGAVGGLIAGLGKTVDFTFLLRHYDKDFHTFYGQSLAESSRPINEDGTYWGLRYSPSRKWQFSSYYDYFSFPWLKYLVNAPSQGYSYFLHARYKPHKRFSAYLLFQQKNKERNLPNSEASLVPLVETERRSAVLHMQWDKPMKYVLRTRIQYGAFRYIGYSESRGFTVVQDATWKFAKGELSGRLAFFKTDNYDSRQYVYEKDMLYAFSIPAYYDTGTRHYLLLKYNLSNDLRLWLRWSQTRYQHLDSISSGLNSIAGKTRSEIKAQLLYQF
ncbi:helix-hairpin-helix protein [Dyadobacter jejuensis]|uniref:Helix-hairpin-helix protein n=1 Tax=Dyadobacter jejuensis TaxID=1082580 RepID=A0A316AEA4_9BACT|nr:helix-hairpin-helix domain-containing protein [Dyadobacter jejuensis]PWJ55300.1 helix-hairpin-helix protein [Dyadobacter jejuensis]